MTKPRPTLSLFRQTPKPAEPTRHAVRQVKTIPITVVSRAAIEGLVARLNKSMVGAE